MGDLYPNQSIEQIVEMAKIIQEGWQ